MHTEEGQSQKSAKKPTMKGEKDSFSDEDGEAVSTSEAVDFISETE